MHHNKFYLLKDSVIFLPLAGGLQRLEAGSCNSCSICEDCGVRLACSRQGLSTVREILGTALFDVTYVSG